MWLGLVEMRSAVAYQLFQSSSFVALGGRGALPRGGGINNTIGTYLPEVDFPSSRSTVYFREGLGGCIFFYRTTPYKYSADSALDLSF